MDPPDASNAAADRLFVIKHSAFKGYQALSLATPVVVVASSLLSRRRPFTVNRLLRNTYYANTAGAVGGGGAAYFRLLNATDESLQDRRVRLQYNTTQRRCDDYSMIGSVVGVLMTSLIFWNRASAINLVLGGAGLGSAGGVLTHVVSSVAERKDIKPEGMRDV